MLPKFSRLEKDLILVFYQDRVPIKQIVYIFGCSYSYPSTLAKRAGVSREQRFCVKRDWLVLRRPSANRDWLHL